MGFSITKIASNIKNNYGKYLAKTAGAAAVGLVAYDAHVIGKLNADTYAQSREADRTASIATNTLYLTDPSTIQQKVKKKLFNFELENNFFNFFNCHNFRKSFRKFRLFKSKSGIGLTVFVCA